MCSPGLGPDTGAEVRAGTRARMRARAKAKAKAQAATAVLGWEGGTSGSKQEDIAWPQRLKSCTVQFEHNGEPHHMAMCIMHIW